MGIAKITRNHQITIPKYIRELIKLKEGDKIMFIVEDDKILISRTKEDPVLAAAGIWKDKKETGQQYQKRMRQQWKKRQTNW